MAGLLPLRARFAEATGAPRDACASSAVGVGGVAAETPPFMGKGHSASGWAGLPVLVLSGRLAAAGPDARSSRDAGVNSVPTRTTAGRAAVAAGRSSRALTAARRRSSLSQTGPAALRAGFLQGALARERTGRRRARSCAHATPNATSNAGPRDPSVSSMGMPPTCANGALIIGRSRSCSRRLRGAPRGLARDRQVGHGSLRRSRGRPPSRPRAGS
jgi:hypothetical protein